MTKVKKEPEIELYNDAQRWWVNVKENCIATITQFENSMKLQKALLDLAEEKIIALK